MSNRTPAEIQADIAREEKALNNLPAWLWQEEPDTIEDYRGKIEALKDELAAVVAQ